MKFIKEIHALTFTLAGTGMVLITLSGDTLRYGVWITVASVVVHLIGVMLKKNDE